MNIEEEINLEANLASVHEVTTPENPFWKWIFLLVALAILVILIICLAVLLVKKCQ